MLLPYLFHRLMRLPQMFDEGTLGAKSEKEMNARGSPFLCGLDMGFEILDLHDHAVRIGKGTPKNKPITKENARFSESQASAVRMCGWIKK